MPQMSMLLLCINYEVKDRQFVASDYPDEDEGDEDWDMDDDWEDEDEEEV